MELEGSKYVNGVYEITVEGITNSPREKAIYFTFETDEQWYVYTKDENSKSVIVRDSELRKSLLEEMKKLSEEEKKKAPTKFEELPLLRRLHYYDLPKKWDSRNWRCGKKENDIGRFEEIVMEETSIEEPILFNLDDMVIVDENIEPIKWDKGNRLTLFSLKFDIIYPDSSKPYFSNVQSERNYISCLDIKGKEKIWQ